jgi:hypothetical protein
MRQRRQARRCAPVVWCRVAWCGTQCGGVWQATGRRQQTLQHLHERAVAADVTWAGPGRYPNSGDTATPTRRVPPCQAQPPATAAPSALGAPRARNTQQRTRP